MRRRGAAANRILLALMGLLLVATGGFVLAEHWQVLPTDGTAGALAVARAVPWDSPVVPWVMAVGGGLMGVLALLWLLHQLPRRRPTQVLWLNRGDAGTGRTTCRTGSLNDALEARMSVIPGVVGSTVLVTERPGGVDLAIEMTAEAGAELAELRAEVCGPVADELAGALERPVDRLSLRVELAAESRRSATVRIPPAPRPALDSTP